MEQKKSANGPHLVSEEIWDKSINSFQAHRLNSNTQYVWRVGYISVAQVSNVVFTVRENIEQPGLEAAERKPIPTWSSAVRLAADIPDHTWDGMVCITTAPGVCIDRVTLISRSTNSWKTISRFLSRANWIIGAEFFNKHFTNKSYNKPDFAFTGLLGRVDIMVPILADQSTKESSYLNEVPIANLLSVSWSQSPVFLRDSPIICQWPFDDCTVCGSGARPHVCPIVSLMVYHGSGASLTTKNSDGRQLIVDSENSELFAGKVTSVDDDEFYVADRDERCGHLTEFTVPRYMAGIDYIKQCRKENPVDDKNGTSRTFFKLSSDGHCNVLRRFQALSTTGKKQV